MKILIVEDETRAVRQLRKLLDEVGLQYDLQATLDTVVDAVDWFKNHPAPDLVFMDIQLADGISFEIFEKTEIQTPIIFTTAFDAYAIQAFQVNSIDYLLKPLKSSELKRALDKFSRSNAPLVSPTQIKELLKDFQKPQERTGILVKEGQGFVQIPIDDLLYLYSEDSITFGVSAQKRYVIDERMDALFQSLNSSKFFKINRGQIVARHAIKKIHPYFNHRLILTIENARDQEFIVSRPKTQDFKVWMNS